MHNPEPAIALTEVLSGVVELWYAGGVRRLWVYWDHREMADVG
jgi:hypothetical protein